MKRLNQHIVVGMVLLVAIAVIAISLPSYWTSDAFHFQSFRYSFSELGISPEEDEPSPIIAGRTTYIHSSHGRGMLASRSTRAHHQVQLAFEDPWHSVNDEIVAAVRARFVGQLAALNRNGIAYSRLAAGNYTSTTHHAAGYILDGHFLLGVLGLMVVWLVTVPRAIRSVVRDRRLRRGGHCASCNYDVRGLATSVCPECGDRL